MTECENAAMRDLLPDYVAESLDASVSATVAQHLSSCGACEAEVALLRVARAVRPQAVHLDIDSIVARLVVPSGSRALQPGANGPTPAASMTDDASRPAIAITSARRLRSARRMWQIAAALGVVTLGSLSIFTARSGQVPLPIAMRSDTAQLGEAAERASTPLAQGASSSGAQVSVDATLPADSKASVGGTPGASDMPSSGAGKARAAVVSVGDLSDYTDAELQKMLDRLERWDGASSSDVMPSVPLVRVGERGASE